MPTRGYNFYVTATVVEPRWLGTSKWLLRQDQKSATTTATDTCTHAPHTHYIIIYVNLKRANLDIKTELGALYKIQIYITYLSRHLKRKTTVTPTPSNSNHKKLNTHECTHTHTQSTQIIANDPWQAAYTTTTTSHCVWLTDKRHTKSLSHQQKKGMTETAPGL